MEVTVLIFQDDFRNLFTASERMKVEYRNLQEEYRKLRAESGRLRLGQTEMQGELNSRSDLVAGLQLENAKLQQKCDVSCFGQCVLNINNVHIFYIVDAF